MKHREKKLRKAAKRIETTGVLAEANITDREVLITAKVLFFFFTRANTQFRNDCSMMGLTDAYEEITHKELGELTLKYKKLAEYVKSIYGKTPAEIAKLSIDKQEENENKMKKAARVNDAATPTLPYGPHEVLPRKTDQEIVEEALASHADALTNTTN
jgi:hypothetical protein